MAVFVEDVSDKNSSSSCRRREKEINAESRERENSDCQSVTCETVRGERQQIVFRAVESDGIGHQITVDLAACMALSSLTGYQISVLIIILAFNFLFWFSIIVWRAMHMGGVVTASRRYMHGMRSLLRSGTPATRSRSPSQSHSSSVNAAERGSQVNQPPPPYEEAIKYPSISSLLSSPCILTSAAASAGHQNRALAASVMSSSEDVAEGPVTAAGGALKKQLIRSLSCSDLGNIARSQSVISHHRQ